MAQFSLSSTKVNRMTYNRQFSLNSFSSWNDVFIVCCWFVDGIETFSTFIWLSVSLCLFDYSGNIDVYNGNISNFLSIYSMFLLLFFVFFFFIIIIDRNSNRTHSCVLAKENYMFDHLPRSTLMNAISIGLYIVHSLLIENTTISSHLFSNQANELEKKKQDFCVLLLLLFLLFVIAILLKSWSAARHVLRVLEVHASRLIQSNYKFFLITIGLFGKENDWPLIDIESSFSLPLFQTPLRCLPCIKIYIFQYYSIMWCVWNSINIQINSSQKA